MGAINKFDLDGRVALVTGTSLNGMGGASAMVLAEAGAMVFLVDQSEENVKKVAEKIKSARGTVEYYVCDVSVEENCKAAVEACVSIFGRLDIMVLTAGIPGTFEPGNYDVVFDTENWRRINGVNLDGVWFMVKYGYAECAKGGVGSIIMTGSTASLKCAGSGAYTATKGAVRTLTHFFCKEFGALGIRVNTIYPGLTVTEMTHPFADSEPVRQRYKEVCPLGRVGMPEDIAMGVLYLASDASSYVTGQQLVIDGGMQFV